MGGVNVQHSLHLQYHDWGALEQGFEPPTAPRAPQHKWLPTALDVCALGLNAEHEFRVWVTILGRMSRHFTFQTTGPVLLIVRPTWSSQSSSWKPEPTSHTINHKNSGSKKLWTVLHYLFTKTCPTFTKLILFLQYFQLNNCWTTLNWKFTKTEKFTKRLGLKTTVIQNVKKWTNKRVKGS